MEPNASRFTKTSGRKSPGKGGFLGGRTAAGCMLVAALIALGALRGALDDDRLAGLAGPTLFATTCSTQLRDAVTGAGVSYIGSLVSSILSSTLP